MMFCSADGPHLVCPFVQGRALGLLQSFSHCGQCCSEHGHAAPAFQMLASPVAVASEVIFSVARDC